MRDRSLTAAAVVAVALTVMAGSPAPRSAAASDPFEPVLGASPVETAVPVTVVVRGSCPALDGDPVESDAAYEYPGSATLDFPAVGVTSENVELNAQGEFSRSFSLPGSLAQGRYAVTLSCDLTEDSIEAFVTVLPPPEVVEPPTLVLDRYDGAVGDGVTATGICPSERAVRVAFGRVAVGVVPVDPSTDAFEPVIFQVPDVAPGTYEVVTSCGASASFQVQAPIPATLLLDPVTGEAGDEVTASGTCPLPSDGATLLFRGDFVRELDVDPRTGEFAAVLPVPDVAAGDARVTTDCGGAADFTVVALAGPAAPGTPGPPRTPGTPQQSGPPGVPSPTPPTRVGTPDGVRVVVPDLTGMTEDEAVAALGDDLRLRRPSGGDGTIQRQDPTPGTLVEPASAVSVVLADEPAASSIPWWPAAALLLVLLVGLAAERVHRARRRGREERWIDEQVRTAMQPRAVMLSDVPDSAVPGLDVRLEVHRNPARL